MYCQKCGKPIDDESAFCKYCGAEINGSASAEVQKRDKSVLEKNGYSVGEIVLIGALVFCIFLLFVSWASVHEGSNYGNHPSDSYSMIGFCEYCIELGEDYDPEVYNYHYEMSQLSGDFHRIEIEVFALAALYAVALLCLCIKRNTLGRTISLILALIGAPWAVAMSLTIKSVNEITPARIDVHLMPTYLIFILLNVLVLLVSIFFAPNKATPDSWWFEKGKK